MHCCLFSTDVGTCPPGWSLNADSCYYIDTNPVTFADAETSCESMGAKLTSIHNAEDQTYHSCKLAADQKRYHKVNILGRRCIATGLLLSSPELKPRANFPWRCYVIFETCQIIGNVDKFLISEKYWPLGVLETTNTIQIQFLAKFVRLPSVIWNWLIPLYG